MGVAERHSLAGRELELRRIGAALARARSGASDVLVIRGEAGIGKTALLDEAASLADGMRVLRTRGIEPEAGLPFAALVSLVRPAAALIDEIPPPLAGALCAAVGLGPQLPSPPLQVGVGLLHLFALAAEERPLLVIIDDAQWLDGASSSALLFAARRLGAEGVVMLFAVREDAPPDTSGLDELTLTGLDLEAARALVADTNVPAQVLAGLHQSVRGNPLALIEAARALCIDDGAGPPPFSDLARPGDRIERALSNRIARLEPDVRRALVVAAAGNGSTTGELAVALRELNLELDVLGEAEAAGIVSLGGSRVEFSHPLLRTVAYHAAPPAERRSAHLAVARALATAAPTRSVIQRAAAATVPDAQLADALEDVAKRAADRGAPTEATRLFERSATLTPEIETGARRLLAASQQAAAAADFPQSLVLAKRGLATAPVGPLHAAFELQCAVIELRAGSPRTAEDQLLDAAGRAEATNPGTAALMLTLAARACFTQAECGRALELSDRAVALARAIGGAIELDAAATQAAARILCGAGAVEAETLLRVDAAISSDAAGGPAFTPLLMPLPQQLGWIEKFDDATRILRRRIASARARALPMPLPYDLAALAEIELLTGDLVSGYANAVDAVQLARDSGQSGHLALALVTLARIEAQQKRETECSAHVAEARAIAEQLGMVAILMQGGLALGQLELGAGAAEDAVRMLAPVGELAQAHGVQEPNVVRWQPDLIEAYVRCGHRSDAERELDLLDRQARKTRGIWSAAVALRCRGLLAPRNGFDTHFEQALALHRTQPLTIDRARTELCFGERLRRAGRRHEARAQLRSALDTFERSHAHLWTEPARSELLAAGERMHRQPLERKPELTAQELQVTRAVAEGATNAEVAARLFISSKTVEKHLTSAYRKLGVRSRAQLAAHYARTRSEE